MKTTTRRISLSVGVALAASPALIACNSTAAEEQSNSAEWAVVERRDMEIRAEAAGAIEPVRMVEVKSKASGEVLRLHVESGDEVEQDALLAEIDPRDVRNAYNQAEADLAVAEASLTTAITQAARVKELLDANVATQQEYETAALTEANARAQKIKAETNLELARERLEDVTIRAPIDGTIIARGTIDDTGAVEEIEEGSIISSAGQDVSGGTVLITMADLSVMQLRALVDETDLGRIRAGQAATVTVDAYRDRTFRGEILKIEPQAVVDENVTMFPVLVRLDNAERLLKPGMNANVVFEIAERNDVVTVPNAAIINPIDAVAAGAVLGIDEDAVNAALQGGGRLAAAAPGGAPAEPAEDDSTARGAVSNTASGARGGRFVAGRAATDGAGATGVGEFGGQNGGEGIGGRARRGAGEPNVRRAVVFVADTSGQPEARSIRIGLNDFDRTEVVSGLEPGERVILMSVARIQAQQQEFTDRIRDRAGGPLGR